MLAVVGAAWAGLAAGADEAGAVVAELADAGAELAGEAGVADGAELADGAGVAVATGVDEAGAAEGAGAAAEAEPVAGAEDAAAVAGVELADAGAELVEAGAEPVAGAAEAGWVELADGAGVVELPCGAVDVTALTWDDAAGATV